ncbi:protein of unknown function [Vibrio tapetis subsp. tapetis]|uniref:Uncharacterized protein n=1 Tax=Vibrio tapetis subsp. tapetis TaxID=1671868 RepID=A0A2N8ZML5_9VIBR|nr:protein of unknown function [Vibrio tapetis subsp. tapetis]
MNKLTEAFCLVLSIYPIRTRVKPIKGDALNCPEDKLFLAKRHC